MKKYINLIFSSLYYKSLYKTVSLCTFYNIRCVIVSSESKILIYSSFIPFDVLQHITKNFCEVRINNFNSVNFYSILIRPCNRFRSFFTS